MRNIAILILSLLLLLQGCTSIEPKCEKRKEEKESIPESLAYIEAAKREDFREMERIANVVHSRDRCSAFGWYLIGTLTGIRPAYENRDITQEEIEKEVSYMEKAATLIEKTAFIWSTLADDMRINKKHDIAIKYYRIAMAEEIPPDDMAKIAIGRAKSAVALNDLAEAEQSLYYGFSYTNFFMNPELFSYLVPILAKTKNKQIINDTWRGAAPTLGLLQRKRTLELCELVRQNIGADEAEECIYQIDRKSNEPVERPRT